MFAQVQRVHLIIRTSETTDFWKTFLDIFAPAKKVLYGMIEWKAPRLFSTPVLRIPILGKGFC